MKGRGKAQAREGGGECFLQKPPWSAAQVVPPACRAGHLLWWQGTQSVGGRPPLTLSEIENSWPINLLTIKLDEYLERCLYFPFLPTTPFYGSIETLFILKPGQQVVDSKALVN